MEQLIRRIKHANVCVFDWALLFTSSNFFGFFFFLIDGSEKFLNFPTFLPREKNNRKMGVLLLRSWNVVEPRGT